MDLNLLLLNTVWAFTVILPVLLPGVFFIICIKKGWLMFLNRPIDLGLKLGGKPVFGANKNWRGALIYLVGGTLVTYLLHLLQSSQGWVAPIYANNPWLMGPICCGFYVLGELTNSFVKRRMNVDPGRVSSNKVGKTLQSFFDNMDGAIGYGLGLFILFQQSQFYLYFAILIAFIAHSTSDWWMRRLKLKKRN
jgi:hypothetical protein